MAVKIRIWIFLIKILLLVAPVFNFLDIEELKSTNYGIDILSTPVLWGQETSDSVVYLSSKHGQQYQCSFPSAEDQEKTQGEEEKIAIETGIPELLRPMESGPCIISTKDWWTYEFCYGKHIKQYHMEDGVPVGVIIVLGLYESEVDWNNDTEKTAKSRMNRYHSQHYVNGSKCDLTAQPREAEVRFMCEEGTGDYIARIDEPQTCMYTITVHTTKICHHPYLKPPVKQKPLAITCNPVLEEGSYWEYITYEEEKKRQKEERRLAELEAKQKELEFLEQASILDELEKQALEGTDEPPLNSGTDDDGSSEDSQEKLEKMVADTLLKQIQGKIGEELGEEAKANINMKMKVKVLSNVDDLEKVMQAMKEEEESSMKEANPVKEDAVDGSLAGKTESMKSTHTESILKQKEEKLKKDLKDTKSGYERLHKALSDKLDKLRALGQHFQAEKIEQKLNKLKRVQERIDSYESLHHELSNVKSRLLKMVDVEKEKESQKYEAGKTKEEKKEEGEDGEAIARDVEDKKLIEEYQKELDKILPNKEERENVAQLKENIPHTMSSQFQDIIDEAQRELGDEAEGVERGEAIKSLASTLTNLLSKLDDKEDDVTSGERKSAENIEETNPEKKDENLSKGETLEKDQTHDKWKVKISNLKVRDKKGKSSEITDKEEGKDLEAAIKEKLKKAGMDTEGRKIEVKIITSGYYNPDDDSIHVLSDEESQAFNSIVVNFLGGNQAAQREQTYQAKQEDSYNFVWGQDQKAKRKSREENTDDLLYNK